jgi:hypothetical protein
MLIPSLSFDDMNSQFRWKRRRQANKFRRMSELGVEVKLGMDWCETFIRLRGNRTLRCGIARCGPPAC